MPASQHQPPVKAIKANALSMATWGNQAQTYAVASDEEEEFPQLVSDGHGTNPYLPLPTHGGE